MMKLQILKRLAIPLLVLTLSSCAKNEQEISAKIKFKIGSLGLNALDVGAMFYGKEKSGGHRFA